jgi:hypothetical protein
MTRFGFSATTVAGTSAEVFLGFGADADGAVEIPSTPVDWAY